MENSQAVGEEPGAAPVSGEPETGTPTSRKWIFGAYALLFLWGAAYLLLFFADRLPG